MHKNFLYAILTILLIAFAAVLILAAPAARVGDNHTCPQFNGPIPHVGGPILNGSSNVFICGNAAAFLGSGAVCNGPLDQVIQGSNTVFINGIPAARQGDLTAHGGQIVQGCANVIIGP